MYELHRNNMEADVHGYITVALAHSKGDTQTTETQRNKRKKYLNKERHVSIDDKQTNT